MNIHFQEPPWTGRRIFNLGTVRQKAGCAESEPSKSNYRERSNVAHTVGDGVSQPTNGLQRA